MQRDFASTHLDGITNLSLAAKVKPGLVPDTAVPISYLQRLEMVLKVLHASRKAAREKSPALTPRDLVAELGGVHFFRWTILPPDAGDGSLASQLSPPPHRLILNVTFDGGWEPYMRGIWGWLGSLLDLMLCNCEDYQPARRTTFADYLKWVRRHEMQRGFYYTEGDGSVMDRRYLDHAELLWRERGGELHIDQECAEMAIAEPPKVDAGLVIANGLKNLVVLHNLERYFPNQEGEHQYSFLRQAAQDFLYELDRLPPEATAQIPASVQPAWAWFKASRLTPVDTTPKRPIAPDNIQSGILSSHQNATHGALVLARVTNADEARASLAALKSLVSSEAQRDAQDKTLLNVAISYPGMLALDIAQANLKHLPQEFAEGMAQRAGVLGDVRGNHPSQWNLPPYNWPDTEASHGHVALEEVHLVFTLRRGGTVDDAALVQWVKDNLGGRAGLQLMSYQPTIRRLGPTPEVSREHFGYADGYSQPVLREAGKKEEAEASAKLPWRNDVAPGELLFGHANDRQDPDSAPNGWLDNGSFLVVRKLRQHVGLLNDMVSTQAQTIAAQAGCTPEDAETLIRKKLMGRSTEGVPAVKDAAAGDNGFDYQNDRQGKECPFHAHIRRANPRTPALDPQHPARLPVPRIARRGMSYGNDGDDDRGLVFMAYAGSIAEQFEVIQRWLSGGNSSGAGAAVSDPFVGVPQPDESRVFRFMHGDQVLRVDLGKKAFTALQWGGYFFAPSLSALGDIEKFAEVQVPQAPAAVPNPEPPPADLETWRNLLEDDVRRQGAWATIRAGYGGTLQTAYGELRGSVGTVMVALKADGEPTSVCGYKHRMEKSIGPGYLGMDGKEHQDESTMLNAFLRGVKYQPDSEDIARHFTEEGAFSAAWKVTEEMLPKLAAQPAAQHTVDLMLAVSTLLADLCRQWFGPTVEPRLEGQAPAREAQGFSVPMLVNVSRYIFSSPHPTQRVETEGVASGVAVRSAVKAYLADGAAARTTETQQLLRVIDELPEHRQADTLAGLILGFPPTVFGNLINTLVAWLPSNSRKLWELQAGWRGQSGYGTPFERAHALIRPALLKTMMRNPVPATVWRTPTGKCPVADAPSRVIVSLYSACQEAEADHLMMFGGDATPGSDLNTPHACPGYGMAMGVMQGFLAALMNAGDLSEVAGLRVELRPTP